jgi:hypothetical protein
MRRATHPSAPRGARAFDGAAPPAHHRARALRARTRQPCRPVAASHHAPALQPHGRVCGSRTRPPLLVCAAGRKPRAAELLPAELCAASSVAAPLALRLQAPSTQAGGVRARGGAGLQAAGGGGDGPRSRACCRGWSALRVALLTGPPDIQRGAHRPASCPRRCACNPAMPGSRGGYIAARVPARGGRVCRGRRRRPRRGAATAASPAEIQQRAAAARTRAAGG